MQVPATVTVSRTQCKVRVSSSVFPFVFRSLQKHRDRLSGAGLADEADARAVLVWNATTLRSIPTDADTAQKTTPIAAGTLAIADKVFLEGRWVRLQFADGQTGWLRQDDLTWLWR